jgi:hypothetical protein
MTVYELKKCVLNSIIYYNLFAVVWIVRCDLRFTVKIDNFQGGWEVGCLQ